MQNSKTKNPIFKEKMLNSKNEMLTRDRFLIKTILSQGAVGVNKGM